MSLVPRLSDHAVVADQHDVVESEALPELLDLARQRRWIGGVAIETSMATGQPSAAQSRPYGLQRAFFAIAAIATFGKRAAAPFHVTR